MSFEIITLNLQIPITPETPSKMVDNHGKRLFESLVTDIMDFQRVPDEQAWRDILESMASQGKTGEFERTLFAQHGNKLIHFANHPDNMPEDLANLNIPLVPVGLSVDFKNLFNDRKKIYANYSLPRVVLVMALPNGSMICTDPSNEDKIRENIPVPTFTIKLSDSLSIVEYRRL